MINVGVIGSGSIVTVFLASIAKLKKQYHLCGIWGRHEDKLKMFEEYFDYYTTDLDKLLNDPKIDLVYVALPNGLHYEYAMKVLKAGKNVFVEKPFTVRYSETKKLIDYANKHDLLCLEAIISRFNPNFAKAKKQVKKIGKIRMIDGNFSQYSRRYDNFRKGIIQPVFDKNLAGGALLDLNVYNIHFVAGLFGMPKDVKYFPNMQKGVDTSGVLVLDYGSFKATLIAAKDCKTQAHIIVEGEDGCMRSDFTASSIDVLKTTIYKGKEFVDETKFEEFEGFVAELKALARIMKTRDKAEIDAYNKDTLMVAKIMDKALVSANINY